MCIYSNFCPKIGCHGNAPLSLVYRSVTDEYPDGTNYLKTKLCMDVSLTIEVMAIFVIFTARRYASAVLAVVVCPSVRLSVCLSQAGIVSKRQHIESRKQRRTVAQGI